MTADGGRGDDGRTSAAIADRQASGADDWSLRMKDLAEATGLPRQAIHFYIQQGLLPPGRKTGRNMAFYGPEHIERLRLIRRLQDERFLPLRAIKALLDEQDAAEFTDGQRRFLKEVRARLGGTLGPQDDPGAPEDRWIALSTLVTETGADPEDVRRLFALGLVRARGEAGDGLSVLARDRGLVEAVAALRAAGFTQDRGFEIDDLAGFQEAVGRLLRWETSMITRRLADTSPTEAAAMVDRALPILERLLVQAHEARLRAFLEVL